MQTAGNHPTKTYAQVYTGVRQDSGDPSYFVKMVRDFYDREGITDRKTVVFSDSLDIEHCLEYKTIAEEAHFQPVFGVGTFFTSEFPFLPFLQRSLSNLVIIRRFHQPIQRRKVQAPQHRHQNRYREWSSRC